MCNIGEIFALVIKYVPVFSMIVWNISSFNKYLQRYAPAAYRHECRSL